MEHPAEVWRDERLSTALLTPSMMSISPPEGLFGRKSKADQLSAEGAGGLIFATGGSAHQLGPTVQNAGQVPHPVGIWLLDGSKRDSKSARAGQDRRASACRSTRTGP